MTVPPEALARLVSCAEAARAHPADPDAHMFLGNALVEAGRPAEALAPFAAALARRADHAPTHYNLGNAHLVLGDAAAAEAAYLAALTLCPTHPGSHNNRGNALRQLGRLAEAEASYRAALALAPASFGTATNLGATLLALHRPEAAEAVLREALRLCPTHAEACNNLGGALLAQDRPNEALDWFARAVRLEPGHAQAAFGVAMALLGQGCLREGFAAYEARWRDPRFLDGGRAYEASLWLGQSDPHGRAILVHAEQGLGDTIQFARYLPLLRARGATVILEAPASLTRLLGPLADAVVAEGAALPSHHFRVPLLSLPHAFATDLAGIPAAVPYLGATRQVFAADRPLVAITVSGSGEHPEDALRSIPAALFAPILLVPGFAFRVVQGAAREADIAVFCDLGLPVEAPDDFADTAAILAEADLVISVDTSVAHLAGALARPVWVLLQHAADFRWLQRRDDSPWYPTATLFRQGPDRRWEPVIARVAEALRRRLG